jgi:hypothetical protein
MRVAAGGLVAVTLLEVVDLLPFISRLIGPNCAVPAISAAGAVEEPLPSISICTFGYMRRKPSAHRVIMLFIVSEPFRTVTAATRPLADWIERVHPEARVEVIPTGLRRSWREAADALEGEGTDAAKRLVGLFPLGSDLVPAPGLVEAVISEGLDRPGGLLIDGATARAVGARLGDAEVLRSGTSRRSALVRCHTLLLPCEATAVTACASAVSYFEAAWFGCRVFVPPLPDFASHEGKGLTVVSSEAAWGEAMRRAFERPPKEEVEEAKTHARACGLSETHIDRLIRLVEVPGVMKLLLFLDPGFGGDSAQSRRELVRQLMAGAANHARSSDIEVAVSARGEMETWARAIWEEHSGDGMPEVIAMESDPKQGDADAYAEWLRSIKRERFDFDGVLTTTHTSALESAACRLGVDVARIQLWPRVRGRWRRHVLLHHLDDKGRELLADLRAQHLDAAGFELFPASLDSKLQAEQAVLNPWDASFQPLTAEQARAFDAGRRVALVIPGSAEAPNSMSGDAAFIEDSVRKVLDAGWNAVLITRDVPARRRRAGGALSRRVSGGGINQAGAARVPQPARASRPGVTDTADAGFEALMFGRHVCATGRPFYAVGGALPSLERFLAGDFDAAAYAASAARLRGFFLRGYGGPMKHEFESGNYLRRVQVGASIQASVWERSRSMDALDPGGVRAAAGESRPP